MTIPYWLDALATPGVDPGAPEQLWSGVSFWLGKPEQMMVELPSPNTYTPSSSTGEVEAGRYNGSSSTRNASELRRYTIGWNRLSGRDSALISGFYRRLVVGNGPWVYVPPEDVNRLTLAQSMCGSVNGVVEGWLVNGGTLAYDATTAAAVFPGGVMKWAPAAAGKILSTGATSGTFGVPDVDHAMPYLPDEPVGFWVWASASSAGPTLQASVTGCLADGTSPVNVAGSVVTLTTTPQPVAVGASAGAFGSSQYLLSKLTVGGTVGSRTISLSNPMAVYDDAPDLTSWSHGRGVPRVVWPVAPGDQQIDFTGVRPWTMTLAETIPGAA